MKTLITTGDSTKEVSMKLTLAEVKALHNLLDDEDESMITYKRIKENAYQLILKNK